jgi:alpha-galactosidase
VSAPAAQALDDGLALTPPMGFNDWNSFGCNINAQDFRDMADLFVQTGLRDAGYDYVNIDDCWMKGRDIARTDAAGRAAAGRSTTAPYRLIPDPAYFPDVDRDGNGTIDPSEHGDGIAALADYVHARGLKLGIYEDAGATTCQGLAGSLGYEQVDAQTFADWGIDYVKYDNCGAHTTTTLDGRTVSYPDTVAGFQARYTAMRDALQAVDRPIIYSICDASTAGQSWTWGAQTGNLWRTTSDINASWSTIASIFEKNITLGQYAGPGGWNDPDMLEVGNGPGLSPTENRSHFSLWSMMAAPLIIGSDLRAISPDALSVLLNKDVIAVDQDPLGVPATVVSHDGTSWVLAKPLSGGDVAVALFNEGSSTTTIATTAGDVGGLARRNTYALHDLWSGASSNTTGRIASSVPAHGTVVYRVSAAPGASSDAPAVSLDVQAGTNTLAPGASTDVTVTMQNDGVNAVSSATESLSAPAGWAVSRTSGPSASTLPKGRTSTSAFSVTAPSTPSAPISTGDLTATATYLDSGGQESRTSTLAVKVVSPVTSFATADTTGTGALFGELGDQVSVDAAGKGVGPATNSPLGSTMAADEYGAVYRAAVAGTSSTAEVTITSREGTGSADKSGLMLRNDMSGGGTPVGVALYVTGANRVAMVYSTAGGSTYTSSFPTTGGGGSSPTGTSVTLKLVRAASTYTGYWSTDGGTTFTQVGTGSVTVAPVAAATSQDAGVFHTSGTAGAPTLTQFDAFSVG